MKMTSKPICHQPLCSIMLIFCFMLLISGFPSPGLVEEVRSAEQNFYKPTGNEGSLRGQVVYQGVHAKPKKIDMSQDSACRAINPNAKAEDVLVSGGKLANVLIYVKAAEVLNQFTFETPSEPVIIDQQLCQFVPRVVGVRAGQLVQFLNSDPTTHNIHPSPRNNLEWNMVQVEGDKPILKTFKRPELFIAVKCHQHPWMRAFVSVFSHPFFAVTGKDGAFEIRGLQPGTYTVAAHHELFGEQTTEVAVSPQEARTLPFVFKD